jgi:hypothetical protein
MSRRDRRAARRDIPVPEKKPLFVYFVVYGVIILLFLGLLTLLFTSPTLPTT